MILKAALKKKVLSIISVMIRFKSRQKRMNKMRIMALIIRTRYEFH